MRIQITLTAAAVAAALALSGCGNATEPATPAARPAVPGATLATTLPPPTKGGYSPPKGSPGTITMPTGKGIATDTVEAAEKRVGMRFLLPDPAVAGVPEGASVAKAENPRKPGTPAYVVEVRYPHQHVVLTVETNPVIGAGDLAAQLNDPTPGDAVPFTDGRKAQWRRGSVRGNPAMIVDPGTQVFPGKRKAAVPGMIRWLEGGMHYILRSYEASPADLQRVADSMR